MQKHQKILAKIGTHCRMPILLLTGKIEVGARVTWREDGETKWMAPHTGIVRKINQMAVFIDLF